MTDSPTPPALPGSRADRPTLTLLDMLRGRRLRMPYSIPDEIFDAPSLFRKTPVGDVLFVGDPRLAKQVLIDQAQAFPKAEMELRFFRALFGEGLLGLEGDTWRAHRRTMAPAFDPRSVAAYAPAMTTASAAHRAHWDALGDGAVFDIAEDMTGLTLTIIARTMFGAEGEAVAPVIHEAVGGVPVIADFNIVDLIPGLRTLRMRAREARIRRLFQPLDETIAAMIRAREASGDERHDLLGRLLAARDAETGARLTPKEIRDEIVTIFMAGHETTSNGMTWTWFLLAHHPEANARLTAELDEVLGGRTPEVADLPALPYTRAVVEESLRLFPPAPGISARVARESVELAGRTLRRGTIVSIAPWVCQRHTSVWNEPERFIPERFLEKHPERPRLAHMPFGAGPRVCIGQQLAATEMVLLLADLAQHHRLELATTEPVRLHHNITLRPEGGLPMRLRRRTPTSPAQRREGDRSPKPAHAG